MNNEKQSAAVTPGRLTQLQNPISLLAHKNHPRLCMKDIRPSPKRSTKLNLTLKSTRVVRTSHQHKRPNTEHSGLPSFLFDFLDEEKPQLAKPPRNPINIFEPEIFKARHKNQRISEVTPLAYVDTEERFPEISYQRLSVSRETRIRSNRKSSLDPTAFYKPYVIEITPRASVTLYGVEPISLPLASHNDLPKKNKKYSTAMNLRGIAAEKYKKIEASMQPVVISSPAKSFADKLQRVQDIAKEAEESFYVSSG